MRPDQLEIAQEAYAAAADYIDKYIDKLSSTPRHILRNHVAFEVAHRMKQGVERKQDLIELAIQAALSEIGLQYLAAAEDSAIRASA